MEREDELMNVIGITAVSLLVIALIVGGISVYDEMTPMVVTYTGVVSNINSDKIVFENGDVLFTCNIKNFDWVLHRKYEITVEERYDHIMMRKSKKVVGAKIIEEVV